MSKVFRKIELLPFSVPNFVTAVIPAGNRQEGLKKGLTFHITEIEEETLIALADQFKADLLEKARKGETRE